MILDRITIDIDHYVPNFQMKALRAYHGLKRNDDVEEVVIHISTSGKGLHLQGNLSRILTDEARESIRRDLCDDAKRVGLDAERGAVGHATDIFWTEKEGNDEERIEMPDIWDALDYLEARRAPDQSRVKALAQRGRKGVWDTRGINRPSVAEMESDRAHLWGDA